MTDQLRVKFARAKDKEEIIGWNGLYDEVPHIHRDEGRRREDVVAITWDEIEHYLAAYLGGQDESNICQ